MATVDEHEEVCKLLALKHIAGNHVLELLALRLAALSKTIAWQVYKIPKAAVY